MTTIPNCTNRDHHEQALYSQDFKTLYKFNDVHADSYTIMDGVEVIANSAFQYCSTIKEIVIPDSVKIIEKSAFHGCCNLVNIIIPNSVIEIQDRAFCYCESIQKISIPNSVTRVGKSVFDSCFDLKSVTMSNSITAIEDYSFYNCRSLRRINIPNGVKSIGYKAFHDCNNIKIKELPISLEIIKDYAFYDCNNLNVDISQSVVEIGSHAFTWDYCMGYGRELIMPNSLKKIGASAFENCHSIHTIRFGKSIDEIGKFAFAGCTALQHIYIPASLRIIGDYVFAKKNKSKERYKPIKTIFLEQGSKYIIDGAMMVDQSTHRLVGYYPDLIDIAPTHVVIDDTIESIASEIFWYNDISTVTLPRNFPVITEDTFGNCNVQTIIIKNPNIVINDTRCKEANSNYCNESCDSYKPNFYSDRCMKKDVFGMCDELLEFYIPKGALQLEKKLINMGYKINYINE